MEWLQWSHTRPNKRLLSLRRSASPGCPSRGLHTWGLAALDRGHQMDPLGPTEWGPLTTWEARPTTWEARLTTWEARLTTWEARPITWGLAPAVAPCRLMAWTTEGLKGLLMARQWGRRMVPRGRMDHLGPMALLTVILTGLHMGRRITDHMAPTMGRMEAPRMAIMARLMGIQTDLTGPRMEGLMAPLMDIPMALMARHTDILMAPTVLNTAPRTVTVPWAPRAARSTAPLTGHLSTKALLRCRARLDHLIPAWGAVRGAHRHQDPHMGRPCSVAPCLPT